MADGSVTIDTSLDEKGFKTGLSKLNGLAKGALKGITVATGAVTAGFTAMVGKAVSGAGELEQQIGGVEKIFGSSAGKVQQYAKEAYKTAGVGANEYMSTITSFSARLLQGLGGDTSKAADIANQAMIDMSDNANTFGTSIESIQNAYQGFAKQNYTMLDNLKLRIWSELLVKWQDLLMIVVF